MASHLIDVSTGHRYPLAEVVRVGRDPQNGVRLTDLRVSRHHFEIRRQDSGRYRLTDLGSRAGTFIGGRRVDDVLLVDGDEIQVGETRLRYQCLDLRSMTVAHVSVDGPASSVGEATMQSRLPVAPTGTLPGLSEGADLARLRQDFDRMRSVLMVVGSLAEELELPGVLNRLLESVLTVLEADRGAVILFEPGTSLPSLRVARTREGANDRWVLTRAIIDEAVTGRQGVLSVDAGNDERFSRSASVNAQGVRSVLCVPMLQRDELLGVVYLDSSLRSGAFTESDLELLLLLATQSAVIVRNAVMRKRLDLAADIERQRVERALRGLRDGVIILDASGRVSLLNPRAEDLVEHLTDVTLGDPLTRLGNVELATLLARGGDEVEVELAGPPKRIFQMSAIRTASSEGSGAETVITLRDVTDARQREATASRNERLSLVGQLAGGIAHDFNNLLCVIRNYAEIGESYSSDSPLAEDLGEIRRAADAAATLTRQLLAFSRREDARPQVIDLNVTVEELQKILRRTLGEHVQLSWQSHEGLWRTKADPGKIEQVLMNLVVNARDAMPEGGVVALRTANVELTREADAAAFGVPLGRFVHLSVRDTGCGMDAEVAARVFEPFFTTKTGGRGTGLGLATVHSIVRQAGGGIRLTTTAGQGATFDVLLPATDASRAPTQSTPTLTLGKPGAGKCVLLVEDEVAVRRVCARVLSAAGFDVIEAADGQQGLALASDPARHIDLVLCDVIMPRLLGPELGRRLAELRPELPIVFISGHTDGHLERAALPGGFRLVRKPFQSNELLTEVLEALQRPARA